MARSRKVTDKINRAQFEVNLNLSPEEMAESNALPGAGYYRTATLDDIINNFMVSHVGNDKVLNKVPRHEVAYWAQRGLQELSYDILLAEKNIEFELNDAIAWPLPSDFVNIVKLVYVDENGYDRPLTESRHRTAKQGLLQDGNYAQIYDNTGQGTVAGKSESTLRFQSEDSGLIDNDRRGINDGRDFYSDDVYDYYYSGYYGRRFGLEPELQNLNANYQIDWVAGIVYFDSSFSEGDIIGMRYISDGIGANDDLAKVYVPKLAEDALYAFMLYSLTKIRPTTAQLAPMYQKEMKAKMRNAKIRLSNYKPEEMVGVLRNRAKWIKH